MGMCHVPWRLLAVAVLLVGECSGGLGLAAEAAAHGDFAAPAQHGALPPQVQAMVAQLVETVEALRAEVLELKADRGRSQERAAALETRVGELELFMADVLEKEAAEAEARRQMPADRAETAEHRHLQAEQACESGQEFQAMTAAAMAACCPAQSAGGHRRFLQASCELPDTCPSMACAAVFVPFMEDCGQLRVHVHKWSSVHKTDDTPKPTDVPPEFVGYGAVTTVNPLKELPPLQKPHYVCGSFHS